LFKFTPDEIERMEQMIDEFSNDDRRPFLSGTEIDVRNIELSNSRNYNLKYEIKFSIEAVDEEDE